ncbi:N-acetylneuraminate synthase family protein, partial [Streptococcus pneumoniae]|uniref:N-acetylneuraminate synthase family protein n=1 Tax=Streptococcus pneumoniae TaxID=1313 RepID=UPI001CBE4C70
MLGARILEVHFTMNRGFPGTDHGFSIEPGGLRRLVEDSKRIPIMRGTSRKVVTDNERKGFVYKQGRAIHITKPISAGEKLTTD